MNWPPGFVRCLKDAGRAPCWAQQISCGAGLGSGSGSGLTFKEIFASLVTTYEKVRQTIASSLTPTDEFHTTVIYDRIPYIVDQPAIQYLIATFCILTIPIKRHVS